MNPFFGCQRSRTYMFDYTGCDSTNNVSIGTDGNITISNMSIGTVKTFNNVVNNNGSDLNYLVAGKGRTNGISSYQTAELSEDYTAPSDTNMVENYNSLDPDGYKNEFGVIDFVESETEAGGHFVASNGFSAPFFAAVSDKRSKSDIKPINSALSKIQHITGYSYKLKNSKNTTIDSAGVIAQELSEVLPEAVLSDKESGKLAVNYNAIIPLLIEGIKELQTAVESKK